MSRMFVNLCLAATATALLGALSTWGYGYPDEALMIFISAATIPIALVLLKYINSNVAGHYLAANLFAQTIVFAVDPAISCVTLIALAAGVAMFEKGSRVWLLIIVARCVWVALTQDGELASATATVSGIIAAVVFSVVQIIERSRAQSSKRERTSKRRSTAQIALLTNMAERVFDAYVQVDGDQISRSSNTIKALLGYDKTTFAQQPLRAYLHPEENDLAKRLAPSQQPTRSELRMRHADGRWVWVEAYCVPDIIYGEPNRFFVVLRDYEKQRQVTDQLTQVQRLESMGTMAAAIAHDFNNMLTVIMGLADELEDSNAKEDIIRTTANASAITNKLLTFGHAQRGTAEVHDVSYLIRQLSPLIQHMLDSRYILIESYVEEPTLARIAESEFEQVLVNLVNNAREAMHDGGELEVALYVDESQQSDYAVLEVRDTGSGMDADTQAKIFDPFYSTKSDKTNSGLGLSSCYGIASRYGGKIEVDSEVGSGTSLRVMLPIAETRDHEPVIEVLDGERTIIVVDDDPGVLRVVKGALTRAGHNVRAFNDGRAAIEYFSPNKASLLVSDMVMEGMSGPELAERLRRRAPELPILFISSFPKEHQSSWAPDERTGYLAKPFRAEEVVARAEALMSANARQPTSQVLPN